MAARSAWKGYLRINLDFDAPPIHEQVQIIKLMDALKQSLALRGKKEEKPVAAKKPAKKVARSTPPAKVTKERKRRIS